MKTNNVIFSYHEKVAYVCNTVKPELSAEVIETQTKDYEHWVEDDFLCKNFIPNGFSNDLYD